MAYEYRLYATDKRTGIIVKTMLGNNKDEMSERFEKWFIKSFFEGTRNDIKVSFDYVQHASYTGEKKRGKR